MATTTPNYGWTVPTSTDLVKDGATAIETLGDAIDASMNTALGTKKSGLVLLNTTSFSGVASQSINSIFTSTYNSYLLVVERLVNSASTQQVRFRLRSGTTDNSASYYYSATLGRVNADTTFYPRGSNDSSFYLGNCTTSSRFSMTMWIHNPFLAEETLFNYMVTHDDATSLAFGAGGGLHNDATSFNGINIFPAANNISGRMSIYGVNR